MDDTWKFAMLENLKRMWHIMLKNTTDFEKNTNHIFCLNFTRHLMNNISYNENM